MINKIKKEFLLRGYDFDWFKIKENLYVFYDLYSFIVIKDPETFSFNKNFEVLNFENYALMLAYNGIKDISALSNIIMPNLTDLNLSSNKIEDIAPLADFSQLDFLDLCRNEIKDISALSYLTMPNLKYFYLADNKIGDITPLLTMQLPNLEALDLQTNFYIPLKQMKALIAHLPKCKIYQNNFFL